MYIYVDPSNIVNESNTLSFTVFGTHVHVQIIVYFVSNYFQLPSWLIATYQGHKPCDYKTTKTFFFNFIVIVTTSILTQMFYKLKSSLIIPYTMVETALKSVQ